MCKYAVMLLSDLFNITNFTLLFWLMFFFIFSFSLSITCKAFKFFRIQDILPGPTNLPRETFVMEIKHCWKLKPPKPFLVSVKFAPEALIVSLVIGYIVITVKQGDFDQLFLTLKLNIFFCKIVDVGVGKLKLIFIVLWSPYFFLKYLKCNLGSKKTRWSNSSFEVGLLYIPFFANLL